MAAHRGRRARSPTRTLPDDRIVVAAVDRPLDLLPALLELYTQGQLDLDTLVTNTYSLDEINQGFEDMRNGKTSAASSSTTERATTESCDVWGPTPDVTPDSTGGRS